MVSSVGNQAGGTLTTPEVNAILSRALNTVNASNILEPSNLCRLDGRRPAGVTVFLGARRNLIRHPKRIELVIRSKLTPTSYKSAVSASSLVTEKSTLADEKDSRDLVNRTRLAAVSTRESGAWLSALQSAQEEAVLLKVRPFAASRLNAQSPPTQSLDTAMRSSKSLESVVIQESYP
ncbi:hypothetical protein ACOME3_003952 [Neoechinorhynchus agilis]